jgi:hypothetical protein
MISAMISAVPAPAFALARYGALKKQGSGKF